MKNLESNNPIIDKTGQTKIDFGGQEGVVGSGKELEDLDKEYPYAKPVVETDGKGNYLVGMDKKPMNLEELKNYYKQQDDLHRPYENEKWYNR